MAEMMEDDTTQRQTGDASSPATPEAEDQASDGDTEKRDKDYSHIQSVKEQLAEIFKTTKQGYVDKTDQTDAIQRSWQVYNCELNENQAYAGNSQVYLPIVTDAVDARALRFTNTLFPQNGKFTACVSETGDIPHATMALLNHYVRATHLKQLTPALSVCGDVEGQYSFRVDWRSRDRHVTLTEESAVPHPITKTDIAGTEMIQSVERKVSEERPDIFIIAAQDLLILPSTVEHIDNAEIVAVKLRLSKETIERAMEDGHFDKETGQAIIDNMEGYKDPAGQQSPAKETLENQIGVKADKAVKMALIYQVWSKVKLPGKDDKRWCVNHFAGEDDVLGCQRNPFDNDKIPIITSPRRQQRTSPWGRSIIDGKVEKLAYAANDAINMAFDSAQYSQNPVVMTDPEKNPRLGSVVMSMMAIWEVSPQSTQIVTIPQLWKEGFEIASACKDMILQSMGVNPAMLPHASAGKKPTQAQIAQEQQVALESTAAEVDVIEESILTPLLHWFYDLDAQFRKDDILVRAYGTMGLKAKLERVSPTQHAADRYLFLWNGTEATKSIQQIQSMVATMNVLNGTPPEKMQGFKLNIAPILEKITDTVFGPELAPLILEDQRDQLSIDPGTENAIMLQGMPAEVHPGDNDAQHIKAHMAVLQQDRTGFVKIHIQQHQAQMKAKAMAANPQPKGSPGMPGQPGVAGTPRPGAIPQQPRGGQQPAGAQHRDAMQPGGAMPRKALSVIGG